MKWLIVEDALKDRTGHWFEFVDTFRAGLIEQHDQVDILADRTADDWLLKKLGAEAILPAALWHRGGSGDSALRRLIRTGR